MNPTYCVLCAQYQCPAGSTSSAQSSVIKLCTCVPQCWAPDGGPCKTCNARTAKTFQGCTSCQSETATDCSACRLGTFLNDTARGEACPVSPVGFYQDTLSSTECKACQAGTYQSGTGMISVANRTLCLTGTYSAPVGATSDATCLPCPKESVCPSTGPPSCI